MDEPVEINPFQLDGKTPDSPGDFRVRYGEDAGPKDFSVQGLAHSSVSLKKNKQLLEQPASAEKEIIQTKADAPGLPALPPVTSAGKKEQPAKT